MPRRSRTGIPFADGRTKHPAVDHAAYGETWGNREEKEALKLSSPEDDLEF